MVNYVNSAWREAEDDLLREGWAEGLSARDISKRLPGRSRNSVIGRVHRLGLAGRAEPSRAIPRPKQRRKRASPYARPRPQRCASVSVPTIADDLAPIDPTLGVLRLSLFTCRYPIGDPAEPGFSFCGRTCDEDHAFCVQHHKLCYRPAKPKERRHETRIRPVWREGWEVAA